MKNPVRARDHLAGRLDIADEKYPRDRLVATLDLIDSQQLEGDVTTALTTGESVLATAKNVSSPRLHRRLSGIATTLSRKHPGLATTTFAQRSVHGIEVPPSDPAPAIGAGGAAARLHR
ncbi:hypothetical protein [Streptomyces goshikiensis]|uniref:hypothetical protein n=1 Tax=Streptomyces goshikiensis TaxID=1942 RepID=UPI00367AF7C8